MSVLIRVLSVLILMARTEPGSFFFITFISLESTGRDRCVPRLHDQVTPAPNVLFQKHTANFDLLNGKLKELVENIVQI